MGQRVLLFALAFAFLLASHAFFAEPSEAKDNGVEPEGNLIASLLQGFAESGGFRIPFHESRQLTILTEPIESEGVLIFAPPDDLARYTTKPGRSRIVIRENRVLLEDATASQSFDLETNETARGLVDQFAGFMRGDLPELRRRFNLELSTEGEAWKLIMRPRVLPLKQLVLRIEIEGEGSRLKRMSTFDKNGDQAETVFGSPIPLSEVDPNELRKAFSFELQEEFP